MNKFGQALRDARVRSDRTFREIAAHIGKSIGYVSDIETGRKNPPEDDDIVRRLEAILGVQDGHLRQLAVEVRKILPSNLPSMVQAKPLLGDVLLRMEELSPERIKKFIDQLDKEIADAKADKDDQRLLFLNERNLALLRKIDEYETPSNESRPIEPAKNRRDNGDSAQGVLPWGITSTY